jgi:serine/threonine-protein kinase
MGVVYLAEHPRIGRKAAIKFVKPDRVGKSDSIERFATEAWAATSVGHPCIVEIFDFGTLPEGDVYIVMEYLEGETLSARLKREGRLSVPLALHLVWQAATGLHAAHGKGIVHRDLKPDNLFLVRDRSGHDRVKIVDFGIAKLLNPLQVPSAHTRTGSVLASPVYASPEQLRGREIDHRSDVYSLGLILYEMLCGRPPFLSEALGELVEMHLRGAFASPRAMNPDVSEHLERVILRALKKHRDLRLPDMAAFAEAVAADAAWPGLVDLSADWAVNVTPAPVPLLLAEVNRKAADHGKAAQRPRWLTGAAAVAAVIAAGVTASPLLRWSRPGPSAGEAVTRPLNADTGEASTEEAASAYLDEAEALAASGRFSSALSMLERARVLKIRTAAVNIRLTRVGYEVETKVLADKAKRLLEVGQIESAVEAAKAALDRDSSNADAIAVLTSVRDRQHESGPAAVAEAPEHGFRLSRKPAAGLAPRSILPPRPVERPEEAAPPLPATARTIESPPPPAATPPTGHTPPAPLVSAPPAAAPPRPATSGRVLSRPPSKNIPYPSLPRTRSGAPRDLAVVLRQVEAQAVSLAGVSPEFASGVTGSLLNALGDRSEATIYPGALYYLLVREAALSHDKDTAARALKEAHLGGGLRPLLDLPTQGH